MLSQAKFYTGNLCSISIPVPVSLSANVSMKMTSNASYYIIGIMTGENLIVADDVWHIDGKAPDIIKKTSHCSLLFFKRTRVASYNLSSFSVQRKYIGSDLLDYLQTSETHFGTFIRDKTSSEVPLLAGVGIGAGLLLTALLSQ